MKTVNVVAAVIIDPINNTVLATQRGTGEFADSWEFPGGKINDGETAKEALKREILEELGIKIIIGDLFDTIEHDFQSFHLHMECYLCEVNTGSIILKEHKSAKWLNKENLRSVDWLSSDLKLIEKIYDRLFTNGNY